MRVHFRGIALGVAVLLALVIAISVFNTLEDSPGSKRTHVRSRTSGEEASGEEKEGHSPSRTSPRSSTRLRPQKGAARGGAGGGMAGGGGGARAGGAAGGGGGPGARAGRPGGPRGGAQAGGRFAGRGAGGRAAEDEESDDEMEIDETPSEEVLVEERPRGGAAFRNLPGSLASGRFRSQAVDDDDEPIRGSPPLRSRPGSKATRARSQEFDDDEEEEEEEEATASRRQKEKESAKEEEEKEIPTEPPKKEPPYPDWWKQAYPRSAVSTLSGQFVGDQPLFPECPSFDAGSENVKTKRFGYVDPPRYLKNSRNPCWFEWNGKKDLIKCVPYFYVAGAPKAGTVDLFRRLHGHPNILEGGGSTYYWWDRQRYGAAKALKYTKEAKRSDDAVQMKEYSRNVVGKQGKNLTKEILYSGESVSILGDATPTYLTENTQWEVFEGNEGCSEPRVIPANFIRHVFPQAKVVLLLRDPVDRLYSRFLANVPYVYEYENHTAALFHTFVSKAVQLYRECFQRMSVRHCAYNASLYSSSVVRLSEGMYSVFLEDWMRVFPKEQILLVKFEDYSNDVYGHLNKVFGHLGVDPIDDVSVLKLAELPVLRKGRTREEAGFMLPETVNLLIDFYTPFNLRLAELLDDDKWLLERPKLEVPPHPYGMLVPALSPAAPPVVGMSVVAAEGEGSDNNNNNAAAAAAAGPEGEAAANAGDSPLQDAAETEAQENAEGEGGGEGEEGGEVNKEEEGGDDV